MAKLRIAERRKGGGRGGDGITECTEGSETTERSLNGLRVSVGSVV
jgi:hypothetical protein